MATGFDSLARRAATLGLSWEALVTALCLPPVFLHVLWQPGVAVGFGTTQINAYLSDFAVAAIVLVALTSGLRAGFAPLRRSVWLWIAMAAFFVWIFVEVAYGHHISSAYPWRTHAVTAAKYAEYALLAPALPLVLRRGGDLLAIFWSLTLWSIGATAVGIAQFLGAGILIHGRVGSRQGSFLSEADFAALSGAVLVVGLVMLVRHERAIERYLGIAATATGLVGLVLAAAVASLLGLATAASVLAAVLLLRRELPRRRTVAAALVTLAAAAGVVALRGGDLGSFAHFLSTSRSTPQAKEKTVQTYAHRTLLAWIGIQIWKDHPVLGAGWESTSDPHTFAPYIPAAHRHFPNEPAEAFPTEAHPYSTQDIWIESLAELGVVGFALLVAMFGTAASIAWRVSRRSGNAAALVGLGWTALVVWLLAAQSFVAGIPLDAVTWLGFGLVATGAAWAHDKATGSARMGA